MRDRGTFNFSGNLEVKKDAPLEARSLVNSYADLVKPETWTDEQGGIWKYDCMLVSCKDRPGEVYQLQPGADYTKQSSWILIGDTSELNNKVQQFINSKGAPNGLASLNESGIIPSAQLPSYVDDVIEVDTFSNLPGTGESGKIYIVQDTNLTYRWSGTDYVEISKSLALGETSSTAYPGDKGKATTDKLNRIPDKLITDTVNVNQSTTEAVLQFTTYRQEAQQIGRNTLTITSATTSNAGVMSATDKVKVDKIVTDGDGNKYLTDNGNYQELIEDTTETIKTTDAIPVAGGPLADLLNKAGINSISPDTSMQDLFISLFTKELWPTNLVFKEGTVSAAIAAPSFTLSNTGLVEVGATVTIGKTTLSAATMSTTARTYSGFTYGYSSTNDNTKDSSNTTITVNASNAALNSVNYTMKRTTNGSVENATANTNPAQVTLDSKTFKAIEGTNTVKVDITGPTANATFASMPVYYACSNLGKTSEEHKSVAKDTITKTSSTPSNSKTLNVTGVYPYYTNKDNITTFAKLGLTTNKTLDVTFVAETASNKHAFKIPAKFNVTKITLLNTLSGKYEDYSVSRFSVTTETINVQGTDVQYKVYTRNDGTNGSSSFKITFI